MRSSLSRILNRALPAALAGSLCLAAAVPVAAQDIIAVLSSDLAPYREALDGFQAAYGGRVPVWNLA